jgi:serine/threonine protein phosphatase PrpC
MDHSPKNPLEAERIAAAGGWVTNGRVNGVLGVSRSFGDIMYKSYSPSQTSALSPIEGDVSNVWQTNYQVVSLPEVLE